MFDPQERSVDLPGRLLTFGLRFRLALIVLAAAAPALFLTWNTASRQRAWQREMIEDDVLRLAGSIAREQEHAFERTSIILNGLANLPAIRNGTAACDNALALALSLYDDYANFAVTDTAGTVLCSGRPEAHGASIADRAYFHDAMAAMRVVVGRYETAPLSDTTTIQLALARPPADGRPQGVVVASLRADHVDVGSLVRFPGGVELIEFDDEGRVVNTWPAGAEPLGTILPGFDETIRPTLSGDPSLVDLTTPQGSRRIVAIAPIPRAAGSLYAAIRMDHAILYAHVDREMRGTIGTILLTLILALVATRLLASGLLLRPVDRLMAATRSLAAGDRTARAGPPYPAGELGGLARTFDGAAEALAREEQERESALDALRRSETSYQALIEHAPYGIVTIGLDGEVRHANPAMLEIVGAKDPSEVVGHWSGRFFEDPADRERLIERLSVTGRAQDVELRLRRIDGRIVVIRGGGRFVHDSTGNPVATEWFAEDVTERRELEARLLQTHKMEAIGRLAGGVAHDFNNLLTVILGYTGSLRDRLASANDRADLDEIRRAADRAQELTSQLLAFSRKQLLEPRVIDVNVVIGDLRRMLDRVIGENIEIRTDLDPRPLAVRADPAQLEQVILNLAGNARDAMPRGGHLLVRTWRETLRDDHARGPDREGEFVVLAVTDTGDGMDPETRERIFEPFFTTKDRGHGTGLGLATVYGFVEQSGGVIVVESEPGHGTTFRLYFPAAHEAVEERPAPAAPNHAMGRGETILLVEDDDAVRALVRRYLGGRGYRVLPAGSGEEALQLAGRFPGDIDLLLSDVVLPDLTPLDIKARLEQTRPPIPTILMSGYATEVLARYGGVPDGAAFLAKPFDPADLLDLVGRSLRHATA